MSRHVMLSNGSMLVGIDEFGMVHDFYYPYVGQENINDSRRMHHKVGVWVEGRGFSWLDDGSWNINVDMETECLATKTSALNDSFGIRVEFSDMVDCEHNSLLRKITVVNTSSDRREVRLFMHQVFQISRAGRADTALYVPDPKYLLDYKGRCSLLIYAQTKDETPFDQFSIGSYGIEGKEGTFRDAEDGELSNNPVEHGGVDTVLRVKLDLESNSSEIVQYWVIASSSHTEAAKVHDMYLKHGLESRIEATRTYWHKWLGIGAKNMQRIDARYMGPLKKSMLMVKAHIDKRGSVLASGDSSIFNYGRDYYCYFWPRDAAYAVWPLVRLGYKEEPRALFEICRDILSKDGYLEHKYQPDRSIGSTWHPLVHGDRAELAIQEDETASIIFMIGEYLEKSKDVDFVRNLYLTLVQPAANFMSDFIDKQTGLPHASYDLWEEKFLTHTYTVATVYGGLTAASRMAEMFEYPDDAIKWGAVAEDIKSRLDTLYSEETGCFVKGYLLNDDGTLLYDNTIDTSSVFGLLMYGVLSDEDERIKSSVNAYKIHLLNQSNSGGAIRYEKDYYFLAGPQYKGNPWFVTTLWYAQYLIQHGHTAEGRILIDWTLSKSLPSGALSEQVHPETGSPVGVTPLVWSHAELIRTILDLQ
jgi:GH15 family glucan-1,4-alpha-glucosidase